LGEALCPKKGLPTREDPSIILRHSGAEKVGSLIAVKALAVDLGRGRQLKINHPTQQATGQGERPLRKNTPKHTESRKENQTAGEEWGKPDLRTTRSRKRINRKRG